MIVPKLSLETLAEMVGTTRSRLSFFMNRFRKIGFVNYDSGCNLDVHSSPLGVVLNDDNGTSASPEDQGDTAYAKRKFAPPAEPGFPLTKSGPKGRLSPVGE